MGLNICLIKGTANFPQLDVSLRKKTRQTAVGNWLAVFTVVQRSIALLRHALVALGRASFETFFVSGSLFKEIYIYKSESPFVYYCIPNLRVIAFQIFVYAGNVGLFFVTCFIDNFLKAREDVYLKDFPSYLQFFANQANNTEIDLSHLAIGERQVDVSHIPKDITVHFLREMVKEINIEDQNRPGYVQPMNPFSHYVYTKEQLKNGLEFFLAGILEGKDLPSSRESLKEMQNRIRFCIHVIETRWKEFRNKHGTDQTLYEGQIKQEYAGSPKQVVLTPACYSDR